MLRWGRSVLAACLTAGLFLASAAQAAPTFVASGTACYADNGTSCSAGIPAGIQNNDILIVVIGGFGTSGEDYSVNNGFTQKVESDSGSCTTAREAVFWKRTTGSEGTTTCSSAVATGLTCRMTAWRSVISSGDPFDVVGSFGSIQLGANADAPSVTTTVADALVIHAIIGNNYQTWTSYTGTPTTERYDWSFQGSSSSGSQALASAVKASAGSTGNAGADQQTIDAYGCSIQFALKPSAGVPGTPGTPTYSSITDTTMTVSWTAATDADSYKLERAPYSGSCGTYFQIATPTGTSYSETGRTGNTTYCYKVRGHNTVGDGPYSSASSQLMKPAAPGTPTFTNVLDTSLTVNWSEPSGGAASYKVERAPDSGGSPGTFSQVASGVTGTSWGDTGRTGGTTYWYRVRATNATGDGNYSGNASVTTLVAPGVPGNATYTNIAGTTLTVNWTAGSNATSYKVERASFSGTCGAYSQIASGVTDLFYNDSGLSNNTTYCYRMRSTNALGDSGYSTGTTVTTTDLPGAPGNATYSGIQSTSLTVNWTAASGASSYKVERAPDSGGSPGTYAQIASGVTNFYYNDTGLVANTPYWYRVRGTNGSGDGSYNTGTTVTTSSETFSTGWIRYACYAPDGYCFAVKTTGGRIDFGGGPLDYAYSDGSRVVFASPVALGGVVFSALPASANGTMLYCSDCTIANPCASGGNGAIAKRLNSVWVCN